MQTIVFDGYVLPNTEKSKNNFVFFEAKDNKVAFLSFKVSTRRPFAKKDDNGYYPTDIIPCKAFGPTAELINKYYSQGGGINIASANFSIQEATEKSDGTVYPSHLVLIVREVSFPVVSKKNEEGNSTSVPTMTRSTISQSNNPFGGIPSRTAVKPF